MKEPELSLLESRLVSKAYIKRAEENGISRKTVYQRVRVLKWGIEDAVTIPPLSPRRVPAKSRRCCAHMG